MNVGGGAPFISVSETSCISKASILNRMFPCFTAVSFTCKLTGPQRLLGAPSCHILHLYICRLHIKTFTF